MKIFSEGEMRRRRDAVTAGLRARDLEVAFLHTADNVFYVTGVPLLSGWGRPLWAVIWANGRTAVIGSEIERYTMEEYGFVDEVRPYDDEENVWDASLKIVADLVTSSGAAPDRIGVELPYLPLGTYQALSELLPADQIDIVDILFDARLIKGDEEIELLRLAGDVAKIGANAFVEAMKPGVTELSIAAHAVDEMNRAMGALTGNASTSTYAYCQLGEHSLSPHRHPTSRRLRRGDIVALNVFPVIWGYCMELERTYVYGDPTREQAAALKAATTSFDLAKEAFRPGKAIADLHVEATRVLQDAGFGQYVRHGTGHAHGIMVGQASREEGGELRSYNKGVVRPRMVNSIEPGIYIPGLGGFRHSDVMVATESGATLLTEFPVELPF